MRRTLALLLLLLLVVGCGTKIPAPVLETETGTTDTSTEDVVEEPVLQETGSDFEEYEVIEQELSFDEGFDEMESDLGDLDW